MPFCSCRPVWSHPPDLVPLGFTSGLSLFACSYLLFVLSILFLLFLLFLLLLLFLLFLLFLLLLLLLSLLSLLPSHFFPRFMLSFSYPYS